MFIGIDHGTTAMRFAGETGEFKISREAALEFSIEDLSRICPVDEIEGIALCYSMGDNISSITHISKVKNRGLISRMGQDSISVAGQGFLIRLQRAGSLPLSFLVSTAGLPQIPVSRYIHTSQVLKRSVLPTKSAVLLVMMSLFLMSAQILSRFLSHQEN